MTGRSRLALRGEIFGDVLLGSAQPLREGDGHHGVEILVAAEEARERVAEIGAGRGAPLCQRELSPGPGA